MNSEAAVQQRDANADPYNALLRDKQTRARVLDRDVACHPRTVRRVLDDLDAKGPSEAADVIQSLVWRVVIAENRAALFLQELSERERSHGAEQAQGDPRCRTT